MKSAPRVGLKLLRGEYRSRQQSIHQNHSARFCEENFEGRRDAVRNGADGVENYSEASIGADGVENYSEASIGASNKAYTKIIPQKKVYCRFKVHLLN